MERINKKRRILYIYPSLEAGGAEELRFLALKGLPHKDNYEIKVCCIEKIGVVGERIMDLGIEVSCLHKTSKPSNIFATLSLLAYLLENKFDIVQTSLFNANFHGRIAAFFAGVPIIISEEHSEHYQYNCPKFLPYIWSDRILSWFTDKIICCSQNLMDSLAQLEGIPKNKLFLLLNTFDREKLKISRNPLELKKELGLENNLVVCNVASLSHRKGQDILIKAFKSISRIFPQSKLLLIGGGEQRFRQALYDLTNQLGLQGKILFLGRIDNIADYLSISDVFVLASRFEGIPLALLEAMYMQVPVVCANVGGVMEVIEHNKNGILVGKDNAEFLSNAVTGLLYDRAKCSELIREGRRTVLERFKADTYIERLENLYSELFKDKNGKLRK